VSSPSEARSRLTPVRLPTVHPFIGMDLSSLLSDRISQRGDHPFLIWDPPDGTAATWTYREFGDAVGMTAAGLVARGIGEGDAVVVHLHNCPAFVMVLFACARLGAVAVNVNNRYAADEISHALGLTGAAGIITDPQFGLVDVLRQQGVWVATLDPASGVVPDLLLDADVVGDRTPDPGRALCVQLTSGSVSRPKAVLFTHANALWGARVGAAHWGVRADDVQFIHAPLFHTVGLTWQLLATMWAGGTVVLQPKFSASRFWEVSLRHGCTLTNYPGLIMQDPEDAGVGHCYRSWIGGLEDPALEQRFGVRFFNAWGMTEIVTSGIISDPQRRSEVGSIGRAAPEYQLAIQREDGTDAAVGEEGDLLIRGTRGLSVFSHYIGDAAATAAAFDDRGFFRTGDRVRVLPSGDIQFGSRAKDMLKVGGENVAAREIERVVRGVAGVVDVAVVGRPDGALGEVPCAFVVPNATESNPSLVARVIETCRRDLAPFKVPRAVHLIDDLPRATLDKVAKEPLRQRAIDLAAAEANASSDPR